MFYGIAKHMLKTLVSPFSIKYLTTSQYPYFSFQQFFKYSRMRASVGLAAGS